MESARLKEAEECIKKAEKALKTSMINLKFKPDYDSAASEYERAGVCLKNAKELNRCLEVYEKAADCHEKNGILFHAAKCKEQAAMVARDLGQMDKAEKLMDQAGTWFAETGTPETSAMALEKAGKFFESVDPEKAVKLYEKGYQTVAETEKIRQAAEFLTRITNVRLKQEKYSDAAVNIARAVDMYADADDPARIGKLTSGLVLVWLMIGDSVAANQAFNRSCQVKGFTDTDDARVLGPLIDAFEQCDGNQFNAILDRPELKNLDNEYLRMVRKMRELPRVQKKKPGDTINPENSGDGPAEDDFEGGLC